MLGILLCIISHVLKVGLHEVQNFACKPKYQIS